MDSFEINKLIGAALAAVFVVFSVSLISDAIFAQHAPENPGYAIAAAEPEAGAQDGAGEPEDITASVFPLLAAADPGAGEALFRRCAACHTVEEGGANKIGPNLYGVVNRPIASHEGFSYSAPMTEFSQAGSVAWDFDHLAHFIFAPKALVPGTAMSFAGLKKPEDLANLLAYLNTLAASPAPLPEAPAAPTAEAGEPVEGAAPPQAEGTAPAPADSAAPTPAPTDGGADEGETDGAAPGAPAGDAAPPQAGTEPSETTAPVSPAPEAQPAEPAQDAQPAAPAQDAQPAAPVQDAQPAAPANDATPPPADQ